MVVSCFPFDDAEQYGELVGAIARPEERVVVDGNPRSGMLADRERLSQAMPVMLPLLPMRAP